jgi:uncharacterized protein YceH (UPF0502 family)
MIEDSTLGHREKTRKAAACIWRLGMASGRRVTMAPSDVEARLADLEHEVARLKSKVVDVVRETRDE